MISISIAARVYCDCAQDGLTDVCRASVTGWGWTEGNARSAAMDEAHLADWLVFDGGRRAFAPGHVVPCVRSGEWVRPVSVVKAYV